MHATYYPVEMIRALVGVWLFGGCRIDEIRRLELDCLIWDEGNEEQTGESYPVCLLRVPELEEESQVKRGEVFTFGSDQGRWTAAGESPTG